MRVHAMRQARGGLIAAWLLSACLAGCATGTSKQLEGSLVGTWSRGPDPWETLTFDADGKYQITSKTDGGPRSERQERGAWKIAEDGKLELTPAAVEYNGGKEKGEVTGATRYTIALKGDDLRLGEKEKTPWKRSK